MNILFLTDLYPITDNDFQTSSALKTFTDGFKKENNNVQIIRPNFLLNSFIRGKKFYKTGFYNDVFNVNYLTPFLFDVKNKLPDITPYDVIISHMPTGHLFANKFDGDLICGIHISDIKILTEPLYAIYFKQELLKAFYRAKKLICRSYHIEKKLLKLYPEFKTKTIVIPSGIDEDLIIKRDYSNNQVTKILTAGKFIKRKNIDKIILACNQIKNIELTILGSGKKEKFLKKLGNNIKFKGQIPHNKVLEEMRKADIFILPSVNETLGLVYLEAMASGCITIGTKNDGIDDIIKNEENGFLIQPTCEDIKNIILKIQSLNKNEKQTILNNTYENIKKYTNEKLIKEYLNVLHF